MSEKTRLNDLFKAYQTKLERELGLAEVIEHPTAKGDVAELSWFSMLSEYLPSRYQVTTGFVIDSENGLSQQQDIIIFDRHFSPFILNHEKFSYIPAESVYAVFESKQTLNKEYIVAAADKAESVRRLVRTAAPIVHAGGEIRKPKPPFEILAGILTTDSKWTPPLGDPFKKHFLSEIGNRSLQLGCSAKVGAFELTIESEEPQSLKIFTEKSTVMSFFFLLLRRLQRLGSVSAIEIDKYARHIG